MQTPEKSNVVSLFEAKKNIEESEDTKPESEMTFEEIMTRNKRNADRMKKERGQANKSVLRSYRIKH